MWQFWKICPESQLNFELLEPFDLRDSSTKSSSLFPDLVQFLDDWQPLTLYVLYSLRAQTQF